MAISSVWKMDYILEWYTQLPFDKCPRESPTFLIQNMECYFYFCRKYSPPNNTYYYVYLKPKTSQRKLTSFSFVVFCDYQMNGTFTRTNINFSTPDYSIYNFWEGNIPNNGAAFGKGYFVRFCFIFKKEDELVLRLENKIDEKSTQVDLFITLPTDEKSTQSDLLTSLHTDVEFLSSDFGELLKSGHHSDVQMLYNGGTIPVHKAVLAARSKVFSDMFQNNTEENKSGLINMATTEKSVLELCLEFTYKGKILNLPIEKASNLYVLGHVLKIPSLTKVCAELMISHLCDDNYIPCLVLADKHDDDHFKCGVTDYISDHVYLLKTEGWMKFSEEHTKTAIGVFQKCVLKLI